MLKSKFKSKIKNSFKSKSQNAFKSKLADRPQIKSENKKRTARKKQNSFEDRSVEKSLYVTFFSIVAIFAGVLVVTFAALQIMSFNLGMIRNKNIPILNAVADARDNNLSSQNAIYKMCLTTDYEKKSEYKKTGDSEDMSLQQKLKHILTLEPDCRSNVTEIQNMLQTALSYRNSAILYSSQGRNEEALSILENNYIPRMQLIEEQLSKVNEYVNNRTDSYIKSFQMAITFFLIFFAIVIAGVIIMSLKLSRRMVDQIQKPLSEVGILISEMSKGNLDCELTYVANNEFGILADQVRITEEQLKTYIANISETLNILSNKEFDIDVNEEYHGMFLPIKDSMKTIINVLNDVIVSIRGISISINEQSEKINAISQNLLVGSTNQSASVQSLQSTIQQISAEVETNAENARVVSESAIEMQLKLEHGNEKMNSIRDNMKDIIQSSHEISKIVSFIEDISEQTNLLSLNATIEAARAGTAGRGFAVVAQEISKLATETANAVKTTNDLIRQNITVIDKGNISVDETAKLITEVSGAFINITTAAEGLASSSENQSQELVRFNQSIDTISYVIQENTGLSADIEIYGTGLAKTAGMLMEELDGFRIKE